MKTQLTKKLQDCLFKYTDKQGQFGCFEVTIGWFGKERVDYLTYDTNDMWKCFEIKTSEGDFHSKCNKTFIGNYNYYVMPFELYNKIKNEIPDNIGVLVPEFNTLTSVKQAKKQNLKIESKILFQSMIRSMQRDNARYYKIVNIIKE